MTYRDAVEMLWREAHSRAGAMEHFSIADLDNGNVLVAVQPLGSPVDRQHVVSLHWLHTTRPSEIVAALGMLPEVAP